MKKWLKVLLALAVLGIIAAFLVFKFYINKPHADIAAAKAEYTLSASDIWNQFTTDSKTAGEKYNGKVVELDGKLSSVENHADTTITLVFVMAADEMFGDKSIRCDMLPDWFTEAKALQPGTDIKVKGLVDGFDETDVKLSKCSTVK
ncbi:MAG TPA: hypothetical protein PLP88_00845 [Bacteroidales bacterium]|nr:hypothetical protein [Bacteroidales bacterium]